jgi:ADP-heptose:LPS heptosyltransferase
MGRIGDFVLMLSALRRLIRELGSDDCVLVVSASTHPIARREFPGVRCITLPTDAPSLIRGIIPAWWSERRKFSCDRFHQRICLCHQRGLYYELALSWIDAEQDVRLMPETYPLASEGLCTELLAHRRVVEVALDRQVATADILPVLTSVNVSDDGRLLVYPFSTDEYRRLPVDLTVAVLCQWRTRSRAPIVFGGSPAEAPLLESYAMAARQAGLDQVNVELPPSLDLLLEHIACAGAIFAAETGAAHIATALDKQTVVLAGGALSGYCYPWRRSARQQPVQNPLPCFGCGRRCNQVEMFCLTGLSIDRAAAALPAL